MVKNKQENADWSSVQVEEVVKRLNQVETENAELKKYLGILENRLAQLEDGKKSTDTKPTITFNEFVTRLSHVEQENAKLRAMLQALEARITVLEGGKPAAVPAAVPAKTTQPPKPAPAAKQPTKAAPAKPAPAKPAKNDDDFDLFEEDAEEDTEEKKRITEERLKAYNAKKSNKPTLIAKSSVLLDVKVWDDETDMAALEKSVRGIVMDGLVWGSSKLVPVAYGVKKLQIQCVIEDDKVSTEALEEQICAFDDYVQSVDIAAFNKI